MIIWESNMNLNKDKIPFPSLTSLYFIAAARAIGNSSLEKPIPDSYTTTNPVHCKEMMLGT
jgi:hypothetical protein